MEVQTMDASAHSTGSQHRHQDADLPFRSRAPLTQQDLVPSDHHLQTPPPTRPKRHIPLTDELLQQSEPARVVHQGHLPPPRLPSPSACLLAAQNHQSFGQTYPHTAAPGTVPTLLPSLSDQPLRASHEGGSEPHWETLPPAALSTIYAALSPTWPSDNSAGPELCQPSSATAAASGNTHAGVAGNGTSAPPTTHINSLSNTVTLASSSSYVPASTSVYGMDTEDGSAALAELMETAAWRCAVKTACRAWAHGITSGQAPIAATGLLSDTGLKRLPFWALASLHTVTLVVGPHALTLGQHRQHSPGAEAVPGSTEAGIMSAQSLAALPPEHWGPADSRDLAGAFVSLGLGELSPVSAAPPAPPLSPGAGAALTTHHAQSGTGVHETQPAPAAGVMPQKASRGGAGEVEEQQEQQQQAPKLPGDVVATVVGPQHPMPHHHQHLQQQPQVVRPRTLRLLMSHHVVGEAQLGMALEAAPRVMEAFPLVEVLFDYNPRRSMRDALAPSSAPSTSTPGFHVGHMVLDGSMSDRLAVCQLSPGMDGYLVAAEAEAMELGEDMQAGVTPADNETAVPDDAAPASDTGAGIAQPSSLAGGSTDGGGGEGGQAGPMDVDGIATGSGAAPPAQGGSPTLRMPSTTLGSPAGAPHTATSPARVPGTSPRPPVTAALAAAHALAGMGPGAAAVVPLCGAPSIEASTDAATTSNGSGPYSTDSPTSSGKSSDDAVQLPVRHAEAPGGMNPAGAPTSADRCAPLLGGTGNNSNTCTAAGTAMGPSRVTYPVLHTLQLAALRPDLVPSWSGLLVPQVLPAIRVLHLHTGSAPVALQQGALIHLATLRELHITGAGLRLLPPTPSPSPPPPPATDITPPPDTTPAPFGTASPETVVEAVAAQRAAGAAHPVPGTPLYDTCTMVSHLTQLQQLTVELQADQEGDPSSAALPVGGASLSALTQLTRLNFIASRPRSPTTVHAQEPQDPDSPDAQPLTSSASGQQAKEQSEQSSQVAGLYLPTRVRPCMEILRGMAGGSLTCVTLTGPILPVSGGIPPAAAGVGTGAEGAVPATAATPPASASAEGGGLTADATAAPTPPGLLVQLIAEAGQRLLAPLLVQLPGLKELAILHPLLLTTATRPTREPPADVGCQLEGQEQDMATEEVMQGGKDTASEAASMPATSGGAEQQHQQLVSWSDVFGASMSGAQPGPHAVLVNAQEGQVAVQGQVGGCNLCVGDSGVTLCQAQPGNTGVVFRR